MHWVIIEMRRELFIDLILPLTVAGLVSVSAELFFERERVRANNSHDFILVFYSGEMSSNRFILNQFSSTAAMREAAVGRRNGTLTDSEYARAVLDLAENDENIYAATVALLDFFRTMRNCVSRGMCSLEPLEGTTRAAASSFYSVYYPLIHAIDCNSIFGGDADAVIFFASAQDSLISCDALGVQ